MLIVPLPKSDLLKRVLLTCATEQHLTLSPFLLSNLFVQQFGTHPFAADLLQGKANFLFIQCRLLWQHARLFHYISEDMYIDFH